jgi:nucleoside-diphosphate-sugar epimerase
LIAEAARQFQGVPLLGLDRVDAAVPGATLERCEIQAACFTDIVRPGDVVFHLAAFVHRLPRTAEEIREVHEVNHHATARLAEACLAAGATLVFVSTVAVSADSEYGRSKAAAEDAIREAGKRGLSFSIVRFPLLYGPHGRGNMERMLAAIRARRYWPIGDPVTPKSCLFLDDAARALLLAAARGLGEHFVAAPLVPWTLGEIHARHTRRSDGECPEYRFLEAPRSSRHAPLRRWPGSPATRCGSPTRSRP